MIQYQALHTTNHWRKDSRVAEGFRYFIVLGISETAAGTRQSPENVPRKAHGLLLRVKIHTVPHKHGKDVENARSCNCTELVQYHKWWPDSDHTEWTELVTDANTTRLHECMHSWLWQISEMSPSWMITQWVIHRKVFLGRAHGLLFRIDIYPTQTRFSVYNCLRAVSETPVVTFDWWRTKWRWFSS